MNSKMKPTALLYKQNKPLIKKRNIQTALLNQNNH